MKHLGIILLLISVAILVAIGITKLTGLSLVFSGVISLVACILVYLMLDLRPEAKSTDATIIRLTRGSWHRRRK